MALSQIQCLDDNHVNPRTHEAKPEFFYCENQRLALEALLRDGPEAFGKTLKARGLRAFLSDAELRYLAEAAERWDPGAEPLYPLDAELGDGDDMLPLSSHYWPDLSDTSVPRLELGWPDCAAYRGVTRTNVYAQPPLEGNGHIKEIVRRAIAQAQKVIAVVMDMFTDVDIFRDMLDAGFKRRVSVYILLERTALPHFLSMCRRADMHVGHLKNLRVRSTGGVDLITRCSTKVSGRLGHRFMFVDGDKALSGSYNFTWMSSRLEKHMLNVITGQAVDTFDRLFRELYSTSSAVDLRPVATDVAPEPEPLPTVVEKKPSADLARKLYNPKYALVAAGQSSSPASSNSPKDSNSAALLDSKNKTRNKGNAKAAVEAPPLHPGLIHLEKAYLIPYLPTWPEPDPPSDVIGFINIIDSSRPTQVHLQRSEMFGTSQAIRFSSPFSVPEQSLPELAQPRQFSKYKDMVEDTDADKKQTHQLDSGPSKLDPKALPTKQDVQTRESAAEVKLTPTHTKTDTKKVDAPLVNNVSSLNSGCKMLTELTHSVSTTSSAKVEPLPVFAVQTKPVLSTHTPEYNPAQTSDPYSSHVHARPMLQTEVVSKTYKHAEAIAAREDLSVQLLRPHPSLITSPLVMMTVPTPPVTTSSVISASVSTSSISSVVTTPASTPMSSLSTSSPLHVALPVPKPRTVQLVIKDGAARAGVEVSEISVVKRAVGSITGAGPLVPATQTQPGADVVRRSEKQTASVPELQSKSRIKTGAQTETGNVSRKSKEECYIAQQTGSVSNEKMHGICNAVTGVQSPRDSQEGTQVTPRETKIQAQTHISSSDKLQKENKTVKGIRRTECETAISTDTRVTAKPQAPSQTCAEVTGRPLTKCSEAPNEDTGNVTQPKEVLRTNSKGSFENGLQPQNKGLPDVVNFVNHKAGTHDSFLANHEERHHPDVSTHSQVMKQNVAGVVQPTAADVPDSTLHTSTRSPREHGTLQNSQARSGVKGGSRKLEKDMCLHFPDSSARTAELHSPTSDRPPTPDLRTQTPDFRIRTPSSDGCVSPRDDSNLSTTSEEYYDCSDSSEFPSRDPVFDLLINRGNVAAEDHVADTTTTATISTATATTAITTATSATATSSPFSTNTTTSAPISTATSTAVAATTTTTNTSPITTITATSKAAAATTPVVTTNTATASTTSPSTTTHINSAPTTTRSTTTTPISPTNTTTTTHPPVTTTATTTAPITATTRTSTISTYISSMSTSIDSSAHMITRGSSTASPSIKDSITFNDTHTCGSTRTEPPLAASIVLSLCYTPPPADRQISSTPLAVAYTTLTPITASSPMPRTPAKVVLAKPSLVALEPEERPMSPSLRWRIEEEQIEREGPVCEILTPAKGLVGLCAGEKAAQGSFTGTKRLRESPAHSVRSVDLQTEESSHDGSKREEESHTEEDMEQTDLSSGRERLVRQSADGERAAQTPALGPSGVDKRDRPPSARETEGKKLLRLTYGLPSQSRTPQTSRPARPLNPPQTAKAVHHSSPQTHDNTPAPRRAPPRKAPLMPVGVSGIGAGTGSRRQAEEPHSRSTTPHTQPPAAAQGRTRTGQTQNQPPYPKPQASFLHSHSNLQSKVPPQSQVVLSPQNQTASQAQQPCSKQGSESGAGSVDLSMADEEQGKVGFGFSIGKLYSLKSRLVKTAPATPNKKRSSNPPHTGT